MSALPLLLCLVFGFYAVFGFFVYRQLSKPSCRLCSFRYLCPNRLRGSARFTALPVCIQRALMEAARSRQSREDCQLPNPR